MQTPALSEQHNISVENQAHTRLVFIKHSSHNTNTRKAAISVTFNKGHFDCIGYPEGFAHLYEHMLFNASLRYEKTDALDQFLFKHNGQVNGWTENHSTNIQLNCDLSGFYDACDILMDRLTAPLFKEEAIEREIKAINAEFLSQKDNPVRRLLSVQKATCNQSHPFALFSTGNLETLSKRSITDTKTLLQQYHQNMLQHDNFGICVGLLEKDFDSQQAKIEGLINSAFTQHLASKLDESLPPNDDPSAKLETAPINEIEQAYASPSLPPIFLTEHLAKIIEVEQRKHEQLICTFIVDKQSNKYIDYIDSVFVLLTHLFESKHPNGLFDNLLKLNYATDISSYYNSLDNNTFELIISIPLTLSGSKNTHLILSHIQAYLDYLHKSGIEAWRFREKAKQYKLNVGLQSKMGLLEQCINRSREIALSPNCSKNSTPGSNEGQSTKDSFSSIYSADALSHVFSKLNPAHSRVYVFLKNAYVDQVSPHYGVGYSIRAIQPQVANTPLIFEKPRQNPFMSERQRMVIRQSSDTELTHLRSQHIDFKFYQHLAFNKPNGECYVSITDPQMYQSVKQTIIKRIWLACLNETLQTKFFDVELASLHYRVYAHHHGITVHTGGLSERQLLLCIELINTIRQFKASNTAIKKHLKSAQNSTRTPHQQSGINLLFSKLNAYYQNEIYEEEASQILKDLCAEDISEQQRTYFKHNYIESLVIGNWQSGAAARFFRQLSGRFNELEGLTKPSTSHYRLKSGQHIVCEDVQVNASKDNKDQQTHVVWHYIPVLNEEEANTQHASTLNHECKLNLAARSLVLEKLLSHTIFKVLRQEHKMGYALGVGYKPIGQFPGLAMYVSSPSHNLAQIESAFTQAISEAIGLLQSKEVEVNTLASELVKQVSPNEADINQTAKRAWLHFEDKNPLEAYQELCSALEALENKHIVQALQVLSDSTLGQVVLSSSKVGTKESRSFADFTH